MGLWARKRKRNKMKRQNLRTQFTKSFNKFKNTLSDGDVIDVALGQGLYENLTHKFKALQEIENLVQKFTDIEKLQGGNNILQSVRE